MKGYPKHIATKKDFVNLLSMPEYTAQALSDLTAIYNTDDDNMVRVVSGSEETMDLVTETIPAPWPLWKQKGFAGREEVADMIIDYDGEV